MTTLAPAPTASPDVTVTAGSPTVSVLMATYNFRPYLQESVGSILNQTFRDLEFVLIDDGSTDGSDALLREIAAKDARLRLIVRPNKGLTKSLNEGLALCRGEYIARMDADDVSLPQRLEKQVAYLRDHPECVLLGSRVLRIDPYGSPLDESDNKLTHEEIDKQLLTEGLGFAITHPVATFRRDAAMKVGGYREQFTASQDLDMWLRLAEVGRIANLPDVLLRYRSHFKSVRFTKLQEQKRVKTTILSDAYTRRGLPLPEAFPEVTWKPPTAAEQMRRWARAALRARNRKIAWKHAMSALRYEPLSPASWKVLAKVCVGKAS